MTYEERRDTAYRDTGAPILPVETDVTAVRRSTVRPTGSTVAGRIVMALFTIVELLILLRIVLLAVGAREGNDVVQLILGASNPLVAPFEGLLRTDALGGSGSVLDVAAIVAMIGWAILAAVILLVLRIGRSGDEV